MVNNPRLAIQYYADDWLFIENVQLLVDGEKMSIYTSGEWERDHDSGKIWEYCDISLNDLTMDKLLIIANSNTARIRFNGSQYYKDKNITLKQKKALRDMLDIYDAITSLSS